METTTMLPSAAPGADSAMQPAAPAGDEGGYEICVTVKGDGTFTVEKEPIGGEPEPVGERGPMPTDAGNGAQTQDDGGMAGESVEHSESIDSIEGALKAVYGIYQENPPGGDAGDGDMQAAFDDQGGM